MITYTNLGKPGSGRLGNGLFEIASMMGLADRYGVEFFMPFGWKYYNYFNALPIQKMSSQYDERITEPAFHYTPHFFDSHRESFKTKTVDILGFLQSEKYWINSKDKILNALKFKNDFRNNCRYRFSKAYDRKTIAISVRRGDFVNNPNHPLLPVTYYILALFENFPDWRDYNIVIFSDDLAWCHVHFGCLDNIYFADGFSDIEQLCLMSQCENFIISNSTFAWWGAYLGQKKHSKIIRPAVHFKGDLAKKSDTKDHYPDNWIIYDHIESDGSNKKLDLSDVTFCLPLSYDHNDRRENFGLTLFLMMLSIRTNFIFAEQGTNEFEYAKQWGKYIHYPTEEMPFFHRTKMINDMVKQANTSIVANWDCDILVPPLQLYEAVNKLRNYEADIIYPYDGRFARVPRTWLAPVQDNSDMGIFGTTVFGGMQPNSQDSNGGGLLYNKEKYIEGGGENENIKSYSPDDKERLTRFTRLGFNVKRQKGVVYHLDHFKGANSFDNNEFFESNWEEHNKVMDMDKDELRIYVDSWDWA